MKQGRVKEEGGKAGSIKIKRACIANSTWKLRQNLYMASGTATRGRGHGKKKKPTRLSLGEEKVGTNCQRRSPHARPGLTPHFLRYVRRKTFVRFGNISQEKRR